MDFEKSGNNKCIQEFLPNENMYCIIMVKSGTLKMQACTLSLEYINIPNNISGIFKEVHRKVPSIAVMPFNTLEVKNCNFKGDTTNDSYTTGILLMKSDANIFKC